MSAYLQFKSVSKQFGPVNALRKVELSVNDGEVLALLGPNGAGKSTLFGCLLGLVRPSAGQLLLNRRPVTDADRLRFGYLPERVALYTQRSVWENGAFFTRLRGCSPDELARQLKRVGLDEVKDRPVRQLSKGMLQRLGLAIAMAGQPELLVLDEPFNGLDPVLLDDLQNILRQEHERGATLLVSTHTISAIDPLATSAAILLDGQLAEHGAIEELRQRRDERSLEAIYHSTARGSRRLERHAVCL
jgi:ABC-type multidrug transport system ATPase subunit